MGGQPLIRHALVFAHEFGAHVRIVAASKNFKSIRDLAPPQDAVLIQEKPTGIVDAIRIGLRKIQEQPVLILCSDNTFDPSGVKFRQMLEASPDVATIGVRYQADPSGQLSSVKLGQLRERQPDATIDARWVGPVYFPSSRRLEQILDETPDWPVEWLFNRVGAPFKTIKMNCADWGVAVKYSVPVDAVSS